MNKPWKPAKASTDKKAICIEKTQQFNVFRMNFLMATPKIILKKMYWEPGSFYPANQVQSLCKWTIWVHREVLILGIPGIFSCQELVPTFALYLSIL